MILITGATGFLGSHIAYNLVSKGKKIIALKREKSVIPEKLLAFEDNITWLDVDIQDALAVEDALQKATQVYHCAALVSFDPKKSQEIKDTNIVGTRNVVNACLHHKIKRLIHISSIAALKKSENNNLVTEKDYMDSLKDASDYGVSKYESDMEVWRGISEGLSAIILQPSIILGKESSNSTNSNALFKPMVKYGLRYYPTGASGFVDVDDVATCAIKLMKSTIEGENFIICAENLSYKELLDKVATILGIPLPSRPLRKWHLGVIWRLDYLRMLVSRQPVWLSRSTARSASSCNYYSNEKIKTALSFHFTPIEQTLKKIILDQ